MTVVEYKQEHLDKIDVKIIHQGEVPTTICQDAITVMDGETPLAILGRFHFVPGVVHLWALVSEGVYKKPIAFHKISRELLSFYEKRGNYRRVQCEVRVDYLEGQRWLERLGFSREGTLKSYGPDGADHFLYARVNQWQAQQLAQP